MTKKKQGKTKYPKRGKGWPWTVKELEAINEDDVGYTLNDGGSLSGVVYLTKKGEITIRWRYAFKLDGRVKRFSCGTYPKLSMADIRKRRDEARLFVQQGIDPDEAKKHKRLKKKIEIQEAAAKAKKMEVKLLTVNDLFEEWLLNGVARQDGNRELKRAFKKDILPSVGEVLLNDLTEGNLLETYRKVKKRGNSKDPQRNLNRTLERLHADVSQMLSWAQKRQPWRNLLVNGNPAELVDISMLICENYQEYRDRVLLPEEIRELKEIFLQGEERYTLVPMGQKYNEKRPFSSTFQCAMWICLSTLCRIGELLKAEWKDVNLKEGKWFIPAESTKGKKGQRKSLTILLSDFSLEQFKALHRSTGGSRYCFPSRNNRNKHVDVKSMSKTVGDCQFRFKANGKKLSKRRNDNSLVLSNGKNGKWTPHDLRRTGATYMQQLGVPLEIIDRCQNHVLAGSSVRRHYLHYDYADEMASAWQQLGDYLDKVLRS